MPHGRLPAATVIGDRLFAGLEQLRAQDVELILGDDPEPLHQARVATRRLRSDLRVFRSLLDPEWTAAFRTEISWLGERLGRARDLDVLYERLEANALALPDDDRHAARVVLGRLRSERTRARSTLRSALRSKRYAALLELLTEAAAHPKLRAEDGEQLDHGGRDGQPIDAALRSLVERQWRHLRRDVNALGDVPDDEALHRIRIEVKRCRYAAETAAVVFGKPARRFAEAMESMQTVLGEHQDAVVAQQWLRTFADAAPAGPAFVAGELAGIQHERALEARAEFRAVWRRAKAPGLRRWLTA